MAWLAVNENGSEKIFERKVKRFTKEEKTKNGRICSLKDLEEKDGIWIEDLKREDVGTFGIYCSSIVLPKGSIKKLIGRDLTWEDEAVELKEE